MSKSLKTSFIIFIVALMIFGYWQYSSKDKVQDEITVVSAQPESSFGREEKIFEILAILRSISIDTEFFNNRIFKSLVDFSHEIMPEPVGRPNPFLPI